MPRIGYNVFRRSRIRAEDHNEIVDGLRNALNVRTGPGLRSSWGEKGLDISLEGEEEQFLLPARIMAVAGSDPDLPANVKYDVEAIGNPDCKLTAALPSFGRPVKGADTAFTKIRPAKVGAFCWILWDVDVEGVTTGKLVLLPGGTDGECLFYEACSAGAAAVAPPATPGVSSSTISWIKSFFRMNQ